MVGSSKPEPSPSSYLWVCKFNQLLVENTALILTVTDFPCHYLLHSEVHSHAIANALCCWASHDPATMWHMGRRWAWWQREKNRLGDTWTVQQEPIYKSTQKEEKATYLVICIYSIVLHAGLQLHGPPIFRHMSSWDQTPTGTMEGSKQSSLHHKRVKSINVGNSKPGDSLRFHSSERDLQDTRSPSHIKWHKVCADYFTAGSAVVPIISCPIERACHPSAEQLSTGALE